MIDHLISMPDNIFSLTSEAMQLLCAETVYQRQNELILQAVFSHANTKNEQVFDSFLERFYEVHKDTHEELTAKVSEGNNVIKSITP